MKKKRFIANKLRGGLIGVIPTDTIYGLCAAALNKRAVQKVYKLRKRNSQKPMIILIDSLEQLRLFNIRLKKQQKNILEKIWPAKISVILKCSNHKFSYLHRGLRTLALRMPKNKDLVKILSVSGPLVAPSANWEGCKPASSIKEAKKYFGKDVFYVHKSKLDKKPSTLIDLTSEKIKILRKGADFLKIKKYVKI